MQVLGLSTIRPSPCFGSRLPNLPRLPFDGGPGFCTMTVFAGNNKREPNFIDIGVGSRGGWDEVKVVRTTQTPQPTKAKVSGKKPPPPRTPVSPVDMRPEQQSLIIEATKRGRGGKTVTVVKGLQLQQESLEALCKGLKVKMGSGGAVKDGEIEIQGEHSARLLEELLRLGYKAKKSGDSEGLQALEGAHTFLTVSLCASHTLHKVQALHLL